MPVGLTTTQEFLLATAWDFLILFFSARVNRQCTEDWRPGSKDSERPQTAPRRSGGWLWSRSGGPGLADGGARRVKKVGSSDRQQEIHAERDRKLEEARKQPQIRRRYTYDREVVACDEPHAHPRVGARVIWRAVGSV